MGGSGSIAYSFSPGDLVYVIDSTPCQQGNTVQTSTFPYGGYGGGCYNYNYYNSSVEVFAGVPMGLWSIRKGTVIELDTTQVTNSTTPVLTYSVQFGSSYPGTKKFAQTALYPASPISSGYQTVNVGGAVTSSTVISLASDTYTANVTINSVLYALSINLSTIATFGALLTAINTQLSNSGAATIVGGNLQITSIGSGDTSTVSIVDTGSFHLFGSLPGYVSILTAVPGGNGGLDAALVAYGLLVA